MPRGAIRQRGVHLVEQVLGLDELTAVTILQRLQQQTTPQSGFAPSGFPDQDDIFRLGDELQFPQNRESVCGSRPVGGQKGTSPATSARADSRAGYATPARPPAWPETARAPVA